MFKKFSSPPIALVPPKSGILCLPPPRLSKPEGRSHPIIQGGGGGGGVIPHITS